MNVPDNLRYTSDHEWARPEGGHIRIGITDYAQDALGDVVFVQLPGPGAVIAATIIRSTDNPRSARGRPDRGANVASSDTAARAARRTALPD